MASPLDSWSRRHALVMLGATGAALWLGQPAPVVAGGLASLIAVLVRSGSLRTEAGGFGWANALTGLRAGMVGAVGILFETASHAELAAAVLGLLALDGLDGYLARRLGSASTFGALFDMETDAFFVLTFELVLLQRGDFGPWILGAGLLRYLYVLCRAVIPPRHDDIPRTRLGRFAFLGLMLGLFGAFALPAALGRWAAAGGTLLVVASFARSLHASYARAPAGA